MPIVYLTAPVLAPPTLAPAPAPRVTPRPSPGAVFPDPTVTDHIVPKPDKVVNASILLPYHLQLQRPLPPLVKRIPHYIAAALPIDTPPPHALPGTSSWYMMATHLMVAVESARSASAVNYVTEEVTGKALKYRPLLRGPRINVWTRSLANDLGRLAQGVGTRMPTGTNTFFL